jgi:hypothetical protein
VTGTNTTVTSTNVLDTGSTSPNQPVDLGMGENLRIAFDVTTAFAGATSVEMQLVSADDAALSTNAQVINSTGAIQIANLAQGAHFTLNVDRSAPYPARRYVGIKYVIVGAGSAGAILANMVGTFQDAKNTAYKSGFSVL